MFICLTMGQGLGFFACLRERKVEIVPRGGIRFEARPAEGIEMSGGRSDGAP